MSWFGKVVEFATKNGIRTVEALGFADEIPGLEPVERALVRGLSRVRGDVLHWAAPGATTETRAAGLARWVRRETDYDGGKGADLEGNAAVAIECAITAALEEGARAALESLSEFVEARKGWHGEMCGGCCAVVAGSVQDRIARLGPRDRV